MAKDGRKGLLALAVAAVATVGAAPADADGARWLRNPEIVVPSDLQNQDCRTGVCKHNENTDLTRWRGSIYFVHRTAGSQVLGPNSSLRVYRSRDDGTTFKLQAIIRAPVDRDIRDPSFYEVGKRLYIKAITRLPGFALRDTGAGSISVETRSKDGREWSTPRAIGPEGWGFWRVVEHDGVYYSAAYEDGDLQVVLYRSTDGRHWESGPQIYGVSEDTPLGPSSYSRRAPSGCSRWYGWTARTTSCSETRDACAPRCAGRRSRTPSSAARSS